MKTLQQLLQEELIQMGPYEIHSVTNDFITADQVWNHLFLMATYANIDVSDLKAQYDALEQPLLDVIKRLKQI